MVAVCTVPAHALYYTTYETIKKRFSFAKGESTSVHFVAGMFAEVVGATLWCPMDVVKQRVMIQVSHVTGPHLYYPVRNSYEIFFDILRTDGFFGLYRGFGAALVTYAPFMGIYFATYEQLKSLSLLHLQEKTGREPTSQDIPFFYHLCGAATAGAFAAAVSCPLDVVKTRIQVRRRVRSDKIV